MKFTINSKDFKTAVERVSVCLNSKSNFVNQRSVYISADLETNVVTFSATNLEQVVNIFVKANVSESGNTLAEYSIFKRMLNISGSVTIRTEGKKIIATNGKKTGECCVADWDVDPSYYLVSETAIDKNGISTVNKDEFVSVLENLSKFTSESDAKPANKGIYFNTFDTDIVALDGYRMAIYNIDKWIIKNDVKIIVPAVVAKQMRKIITKNNDMISLYADKKYFCVTSDDFTFKTRLIDGEYFNYHNAIPSYMPEFSNRINADDIIPICKEYKEICSGSKYAKIPMGLYFTDDKMYTGIFSADYATVDTIELSDYVKPTQEFIIGVNPGFYMESMQLFKTEKLSPVCKYYSQLSPIVMSDGNYTILTLPVRLENTSIDKIKKLIA